MIVAGLILLAVAVAALFAVALAHAAHDGDERASRALDAEVYGTGGARIEPMRPEAERLRTWEGSE